MRKYRGAFAPPMEPSTPPQPTDLQAVFVYGTLRSRDGIPGWAGRAEVAPASPATVRGRLYLGPGFPYFVHDEAGPIVHGDLLLFDRRHPDYEQMRRVEFGAGYDEIPVVVTLESGAMVSALAWNANEESAEDYCTGPRQIKSGDWHSAERDRLEHYFYSRMRRPIVR